MSEDLSIPVSELGRLAEILLEHVRQETGEQVRLEKDYFWDIIPEQLYNVYEEPENLGIGSLYDTWEDLERVPRDPLQALTYPHLVWLSDVLRAVGNAAPR